MKCVLEGGNPMLWIGIDVHSSSSKADSDKGKSDLPEKRLLAPMASPGSHREGT